MVEALESKHLSIPFCRSLDVAHADGYVIDAFEFHGIIRSVFLAGPLDSSKITAVCNPPVTAVAHDLRSALLLPKLRLSETVIQFAASQCVDKRHAIFERTTDGAPNDLRFCVIVDESRDQDVISVSDPATFVMKDVIFAADRSPNEALRWKTWISDGICRIPVLARVCELPVLVANGNDRRGQIAAGMELMKSGGIL
jgi:hypothetical protein